MQMQARDARLNPMAAALVSTGADLGDVLLLIDEFRDAFALELSDGRRGVKLAAATPMEKFRRALGVA